MSEFGSTHNDCELASARSMDFAFGGAILTAADPDKSPAELEKLVRQGLKEVTMHEVGHTLGSAA